jgi:glycosyltransferase involved in cell wall biosynthesis
MLMLKHPPFQVLVSAYACEPDKGSEPGVGWSWVREIARFNDVWVITRTNNRQPIENALVAQPVDNVHWIYFDLPRWMRFWKKGGSGVRLYYLLWQLGVYVIVRRLHRQVDLDIIHHLTFGSYWMPSFLPLLPVPFVWGPLGGAESAPPTFWSSFGLRGKVYELLRDAARKLAELNPLVKLSARRAVLTLSKTDDTKKRLEAFGAQHVVVYSEVGLPAEEIRHLSISSSHNRDCFRIVSLGRLIHWKGFELALKAFAKFHSQFPASDYWLIGGGPERKRLERLCQKLGVTGSVRFLGSMSRAQGLEKLLECDVLVHPSLHDSGGWVCVEAMASGRPVICLDLGGPSVQVTYETGIKVCADSPKQVVEDLAIAMNELAQDRVRLQLMGNNARKRAQEYFSWQSKGESIRNLYSSHVFVRQ